MAFSSTFFIRCISSAYRRKENLSLYLVGSTFALRISSKASKKSLRRPSHPLAERKPAWSVLPGLVVFLVPAPALDIDFDSRLFKKATLSNYEEV